MKKNFLIIIALLFTHSAFSQCMIEPWSLENRVQKSSLVIEGKVIAQQSVWDKNHRLIYTLNEVEVYRSFKGSCSSTVTIVTEGGRIGLDMLCVSPSLELEQKETGVFLLKHSTESFTQSGIFYMPVASSQSFIKYDLESADAYDVRQMYSSISDELYNSIKAISGEEIKSFKSFNPEKVYSRIRALANPIIDSLSVDTLASGIGTLLTIYGSNFGVARGAGKVGFRDANTGSGSYYYPPVSTLYQLWTNSKIEVFVPSRAGTGTIRVTNNLGESGNSSNDLFVKWAHSNLFFPLGSDTFAFEIDHVNDNGSGGYTWQMTNDFASKTYAVQSFTRSLEEWRCETQMNWIIGLNTTTDSVGSDNVNVVRFTNFGDSKLGVCYSWYTGCYYNFGNDLNWIVKELDIEFDSTYDWYYGTASPASNQYDFQSVATHELGHGHQLGHVRDASKLMHYALSNGQRKSDLVSSEIEAGDYVINKGAASSPCGPSPIVKVSNGTCTLTPPDAKFSVDDSSVCPGDNIAISDNTEGSVSTYSWFFGTDASPATSSQVGPHTISYSSSGLKTIQMIATNVIGSDTTSRTVFVKVNELDTPNFMFVSDSTCLGAEEFTIDSIDNAESYQWTVISGGTITSGSQDTNVLVNWNESGIHAIKIEVGNECVSGIEKSDSIFIVENTVAQFSEEIAGVVIDFTSEATDAESHFWTFGDGSTSTELNPLHQYPDKGEYSIKLKTSNLCSDDSLTKNLTLAFSASIVKLTKEPVIYPNPVKQGSNIYVTGDIFRNYEITTLDGKRVQKGRLMNNSIQIDVIKPSIYLVKLIKESEIYHYKIQVID